MGRGTIEYVWELLEFNILRVIFFSFVLSFAISNFPCNHNFRYGIVGETKSTLNNIKYFTEMRVHITPLHKTWYAHKAQMCEKIKNKIKHAQVQRIYIENV